MRNLLLFLLCLHHLCALDQPVIEMTAQPAQIAIGDHVTVTMTYRWPTTWHAGEPNPTDAFTEAFVAESPPPERTRTADEERRIWKLVLLATRSGPWTLPKPTMHVVGPAGAVDVSAPDVTVQVGAESLPPQPSAARPLWTAGSGEVEPRRWIAAAIAIAVAIAALIGWWLLGRHRVIVNESPADRLRRDLAELHGLHDGKEISARLGLAVRRWCGSIFSYDGPGLTTRETLAKLRELLKDEEYSSVSRLLSDLDNLRWAAGILDASTVLPLSERVLAWSDAAALRITLEAGGTASGLAPSNAPLALPPRNLS